MRGYREAIFKYAILINVPVAIYVIWRNYLMIHDYFERLAQWTAYYPNRTEFGFDPPVQPHLYVLVFAWALILAALVLMLASICSAWRSRGWNYWMRVVSFLAIFFVAWLQFLDIMAELIDFVGSFRNWKIVFYGLDDLILPALASLWLVYNISYRPLPPDAGAPSRYL